MDTPVRPQAAPPPQSSQDGGYEPPRVETLGSVEELTRGTTDPMSDVMETGSSPLSDRRLKERVVAVERALVLERIASLTLR